MTVDDQITRHEREIGELRGKLDGLATKDFVRQVVQEQTQQLNTKSDEMRKHNDRKFDAIAAELKALNDKQHRITGAADFLKSALPMLISVVTLIVLIISLLAANG
jgi:uncharacterized membrane protein (DUF106 family)